MLSWLEAFTFTQAIEVPVYVFAWWVTTRRWEARAVGVAFAASLWTHPIVWAVFPLVPRLWGCVGTLRCWQESVALAELFAFAVEAVWLGRWGVRQAWAWSLIGNGASFGLGALLHW